MHSEQMPTTPCYYKRLKHAAAAITRYYGRMMKPAEVSPQQYALLSDIKKLGVCSAAQLAQTAQLDKSTVTRNLRVLQEKGLIANTAPCGAREHQVVLTSQGLEKTEQCRQLWLQTQESIRTRLGEETMEQLGRLLKAVECL